jgi:hypothetical protein
VRKPPYRPYSKTRTCYRPRLSDDSAFPQTAL